MNNELEKQTMNFFAMGIREFVEGFKEDDPGPPGGGDRGAGRLFVAMIFFGIGFLFTGTEAVRVLLRRDFAKDTVGLLQVVIAGLAFLGWGAFCLTLGIVPQEEFAIAGNAFTFIIAGGFYLFLGILVLVVGYKKWEISHSMPDGTALGVSTYLSFLRESGWSEVKIRRIAEPALLFGIGILCAGINLLMAFPLLFCCVSVIIFNLIDYKKKVQNTPLTVIRGDRNNTNEGNLVR